MATAMAGLRPATSGVQLTARPVLPIGAFAEDLQASCGSQKRPRKTSADSATFNTANPNLSIIEIEALLREKVRNKTDSLQQAFQNYDVSENLSVTRGEFRRVLESFCFPLTSEQFDAVMNKVDVNPNGTVRYGDFLDKFHGRDGRGSGMGRKWNSSGNKFLRTQSPQEMNTDMVEKMLREKIQKSLKDITKGLRLYDYNRDGHIQRHELRKVLENYCFRMTDKQFDKLYARYDFHHRGVINYKDFLQRLGFNVDRTQNPPPADNSRAALTWQEKDPQATQKSRSLAKPDDSVLAGLNFDQIEVEFRKKMKANYGNLKRIFLAFDKHLDGTVAIDDLKSILTHFTIPLTDQLFQQLMERCGIRGTGKISWELFLRKFQDPQNSGNGQTITIKPEHKYFPLRGADEKVDLKQIVILLKKHVEHAYSSFKNAFMEIDKNRQGRISRHELRKVIENFKIRITEGQMRELMILLDPEHSNFISYHKFLDLFEERESVEGHKWLTSCHKFNEVQKPAVMAWDTVEEILRDKVTAHWKDVSSALVNSDIDRTGMISPNALRRILEKICLPLSDEHYQNMLNKMKDRDEKRRVNYLEFFTRLGVSINPGDLDGLSTQIYRSSEQAEARRQANLSDRYEEMDQNMMERTVGMSPEEIIVRLKDRMSQHSTQIHDAFRRYDRKNRGRISKKGFRQVIESFGLYMTDDKFRELCDQLSFYNGYMEYMDFLKNFEDSRFDGPSEHLAKISNHRVNEIRGDEYGMSAIEVESKLRSKLRENFEDLRGAFYKFDENHTGALSKRNFRRMLDAFMFIMCDDEYDKLCQRFGIGKKTKITYKDFLQRFEIGETAEGHKWLKSVHRWNETKPMRLMSAEEVHAVLAEKAHRQWQDLAKAFRTMDRSGNGVITKRELRETLYKFILPMNKEEFFKLWKKYDTEGKGFVSHQDFLRRLTGTQFAPGDDAGTSHQIVDNSRKALEAQHEDQQAKHDQIAHNQAVHSEFISVDDLLKQLKDRIRDQYQDFQAAFKKYDKRHKGYLSVADIQKVLLDFNYFLDDDQFFDLLDRLKLNTRNSKLYYADFLKAFEEGRADQYEEQPQEPSVPREYPDLSGDKAEEKLKSKMAGQAEIMLSAFQAFDKKYTGRVKLGEFRRVLDNFCFVLSNAQFKQLKKSLTLYPEGMVDYVAFLEPYRESVDMQDTQKWLESITRRLQEPSPPLMTTDEVQQHLRETVTAKFYPMAKAFSDIDYAKIGVVAKEDFREVLKKFAMRLTDEQFENVWSSVKVNQFGNLEYQEFMRSYSEYGGPPPEIPPTPSTAMFGRRPVTACSELGRMGVRSSMSVMARPFTPLVNAESAEKKLKEKIHRHWKDIQKQCRASDPDNTGVIGQEAFRYIISRYNLNLTEDEERKLLLKYDIKNNDTFCYADFLRHFVLNMKTAHQGEPTSLLSKRKIQKAKAEVGMGDNQNFDDAMERLRQCVLENWKDMRREFRAMDPSGSGGVSPVEFRQVLRNYNINLTEDEFFQLMSYYDKDIDGIMDYNRFIKAFLKTA